jgi:hypothetical protein
MTEATVKVMRVTDFFRQPMQRAGVENGCQQVLVGHKAVHGRGKRDGGTEIRLQPQQMHTNEPEDTGNTGAQARKYHKNAKRKAATQTYRYNNVSIHVESLWLLH